MFSAKLKTNARKSTHSGKVRLGTSALQDRHWQDASSYSSSVPQDGRSGEKLHSSSANQSRDRTIWDTKFTEPEPIHRGSSDDVIWVSTQTATTPKSFPKHNAKVSVFSPKVTSGSDRNIFSALVPSKKASESRPLHVTTHHGSRMSHQASSASRSLSTPPGRKGSDFVFKKPTAPPPVSRIHQPVSSFSDSRQKVSPSSPSLSGHVKHQLGNSEVASGGVPTSARAHAGGKTKKLQRSTSVPGLSQSDEIIPILERQEIFTARRASTGSGDSIGSPQNVEWHGKIKMKINTKGLRKLKEMGKLTGKSINSGLALRKTTGKANSLGIGKSVDSSPLLGRLPRERIGKVGSTGLGESVSRSLKIGQVKRKTKGSSQSVGNIGGPGDFGDLGHLEQFRGLGDRRGFGDLGGLGEVGGFGELGLLGGFGDLGGIGELGGFGEMHGGREFEESSNMMLNGVPRTSNSKGSSRTTISSTKSKHQKAGTASSNHEAASPSTRIKPMNAFSLRPMKSILTKSTSKRSGAREPSMQAMRNKPVVSQSPVSHSRPVIDLCKPATSRKSVSTRFRSAAVSPHRHSIKPQVNAHLQSNRVPPSHEPQSPTLSGKVDPISNSSRQPQKKPVKNLLQKSVAHVQSGSKERCSSRELKNTNNVKALSGSIPTLNKAIVPLERLEVRLSPVKIQSGVLWDEDEIDGVLFSSFSTQSELESYLKTQPEETPKHVQQDTGSCHVPSPLRIRSPTGNKPQSLGGKSVHDQNQFKQFEKQLLADLRKSACHEVLHPKLVHRGLSIRRDMIGNGIKCINLRAYGIRFKIRTRKGAHQSRRRAQLPERKKVKPAAKSKINSPMKKCSATPMTGLKMKFTMHGKEEDSKKVTESKANPEPTSDKTPEPPAVEAESTTQIYTKLPIEESIPFKPFEKEVMSSKSAFVSDALDKYLEDVEKQSSTLAGPGHPLLQSRASSITFKMPSKQSSSFKTLDMALKERQMAKYKSKIPTVAETAQKLAKSLKNTSDAFSISDPQSATMEKESPSSCNKALPSDSSKTSDAKDKQVKDKQVPQIPQSVQGTKLNTSPKPKRKEVNLDERKRLLEERLESVNKKLKESSAFTKKSPTKVKSQTSWATKLKIVNSRLVQQLNAPGKNAHLIKSKEARQETGVKIKIEKDVDTQNLSLGSECKPSPEAKTEKHDGSRKGKSKGPKQFVRLDQQTTCDKEFCRLGCICESINLNLPVERLTKHCRKLECMFECVCQRNSVRILRNRKRPTIFQEKSMLFYDGVGMFSNNNSAFVEEDTSLPQEREKPGILSCLTSCARAMVYKPKSKRPPKETKVDNPSSMSDNPQKKQELQRANATGYDVAQPQRLPKEVPSNSQLALKTPPLTVAQEIANLKKGPQPSISEAEKTVSSVPKVGDVVPSVLYAPVQVPLSNQQGMVLLYAPVNTLPYMVQKVPVSGLHHQTSNQAANGSKLAQIPVNNAKSDAQVAMSSDPNVGDNKTKPVAAISPPTSTCLTSCSKAPDTSTPASVSEDHSKVATETETSCKVCEALESGELSVVFKDTSLTTVSKQHTCIKETQRLLNSPTDEEKGKEVQSTTGCTESATKDGPTDNVSIDERVIGKVPESCEEQTNTPKVTSPKALSGNETLPEVNELGTVSDSQEPEDTVSAEQTKKPDGDTLAALNQNDDPTSATKVCADDVTPSIDSVKSVSTSNVQLKEVSQDAMVEMSDAKAKISAVITKIQSPVRSPSTSPIAGSSTDPINPVKPNEPTKLQSGSVAPGCAVADLNKKLHSAALSLPKAVRIDPKTTDVSTSKPVKVPAFSYTMEKKGIDEKNPKLSKTQVFLPGSSMSAINSKYPASSVRSPLLIEIQSECNWAGTKNDILSTIAKHTSKVDGGPGVMRVGKFLVEILSKEEQKNVAVSLKKNTFKEQLPSKSPMSATKIEKISLPITQSSTSQPTSVQQTFKKPAIGKQVPALGVQLPALGTQMPALGKQVPTLGTQMPTLGTQQPKLGAQMPTLGKQVPTLGTQMLALGKQVPTLGTQMPTLGNKVPTLGTQVPSKSNPSTESKNIPNLPSNAISRQLNFAKAGTITAPMKPGTAPLLTSLPPGSILISDGKNPSAYLVPLKAVQDTLKSSVPPAIQSMTLKLPTTQSTPTLPNGLPGAPKAMPSLGPLGSGNPKGLSTTMSSSKQLPLTWGHLQNSLKRVAQASPASSTAPQIGNIQSKPFTSSTSSASLNGMNNTGKSPPENTATARTPTTLSSFPQTHLGQIPPQVIAPDSGPTSLNQQVHPSKGPDPLKPNEAVNLSVGTTVGTPQHPPSEESQPNATAEVPCSTDDSDEFVDVESLDEIHPRSLLYIKRKPRLLKPKPNQDPPIVPIALTSDAPQPSTSHFVIAPKGSRRKTEHKVRPSLLVDDQEEEVDVVSCEDQSKGHRKLLVGKTPVRSTSSSSKRKRKSPVVQQSMMALEEPEFIESYFEVSSDDDNGDGEPKRHKRDKPNKVLHLIKERQRRRDQSDLFGGLKVVLLNDKNSRAPKVALLAKAHNEIKRLELDTFRIEIEETKLKQENFQKRSKLASLLDVNVLDFPSAFTDQKDPDFAEYIKEMKNGSDGAVSAAQSETTSQDSESIDMDSSDDDADKTDSEKGITREEYEQMLGLLSNLAPKSKPSVRKEELAAVVSDVGLTPQAITADPPSATNLLIPARHSGLPMTVPGASAVPRVIPKSKPAASPQEDSIGVSLKGPVPVALHALPFDLHMTPPRTSPVPEVTVPEVTVPEVTVPEVTVPEVTVPEVTVPEVTVPEETVPEVTVPEETVPEVTVPEETVPEETVPEVTVPEVTVTEVTVPEAIQNDLLMEVSSGSPQPDSGEELSEKMEEVTSDPVLSSPTEAFPVQNSSETGLTENDPRVSSDVSDAGSTSHTEDTTSLGNQTASVNELHDRSGIVDNSELETATISTDQNSPELTECINRSSDSSDLSSAAIGGDPNKTAETKTVPQNETRATLQTHDECTRNLADGLNKIPQDNDKVKSGSEQDSAANENRALILNQESENDDEVNLIDLPTSNEGKDSDTELSEKSSTNTSSGDKEATPRKETQASPQKSSPPKPANSLAASLPPITPANPTISSSLSVVSIKIKGGVVNVTCGNGEVIPLAVVKASTDGTMQVAVEGDISSEKVEELLSKSEVMECLEKVADDTCEKLDS